MFFCYFDLSNEQLRLEDDQRVRKETAELWKQGMLDSQTLPAFQVAWNEIATKLKQDDYWTWLQGLVASGNAK